MTHSSNESDDDESDMSQNYQDCPIAGVTNEMEEFYHKNFTSYEILTKKMQENRQEKIWTMYFDKTFDVVYLYLAKIEVYDIEQEQKCQNIYELVK